MSSLVRTIQRASKRKIYHQGRGQFLGVNYTKPPKKREPRGRMRRTKPSKFNSLRVQKENQNA